MTGSLLNATGNALQVVKIIRWKQEVNSIPELRCPECGNELLPRKPDDLAGYCVCSSCNRKVYTWEKTGVNVKCSKCGKENVAETAS